ncbi:MAG: serine/threonine protein kinase [Gammaproteobacteria bacterium]|nr:serine/threonine protein kinase [Gammaproteobacteria bacterium]
MVEPGTQLGKLHVLRQIGQGGMADVYLAEDTVLGRNVAIKVLPAEMARNQELVTRFAHEVRATANLFHPNIVTVYDVGEADDIHFYAMEYLPSGDLKQRIEQGLTFHQSLQYLKQLAKALQYAHGKGFIHRDIKPENILFDENGNAKLTDLGIATTLNRTNTVTNEGKSIGTPRYISPEQAQGEPVDERSDLYSLGIVFYEMITGEVPFDAEDTIAIALAHIRNPIPQLPMELAAYQEFVEALMAKSPDDRFASAEELLEVIEQIEQNKPFSLAEFYENRTLSKSDVLNFAGISDSISHKPRKRFWVTLLLVFSFTFFAFWKFDYLSESFNQSIKSIAASFTSNTVDDDGPKGVIQIQSEPVGATVYLNGKEMGVTPYLGQSITIGEHELTLTHPEFGDVNATIIVENNKLLDKVFKLEAGIGALKIESIPSGAWIELDGKRLRNKTPYQIEKLKTGSHKLMLGKDHLAVELNVNVAHDEVTHIKPQLNSGLMAYYPRDWITIPQLYELADQLTKREHISSPSGRNAEEAYYAILKVDPKQTKATQKLIELGEIHWALAERAAKKGKLDATKKHLAHSKRLLKERYSAQKAKKLIELASH